MTERFSRFFRIIPCLCFLSSGCKTLDPFGRALTLKNVPKDWALSERGLASFYGPSFAGRRTASGEVYDHDRLTAAHPTFPFGTLLLVRRVATGRYVVVRVNDRGPFVEGRIIDLSRAAAAKIGLLAAGVGRVEVFEIPAHHALISHL
ncbi:MAG: septal ring lytic transglycosylase RlpA family protein [Proteobacteria bacterium]|nr:septal ring lytic transglycosylase RlpA family protein [Pseudomonadota bacterium]